jgi:hypothetical protein
MKKIRRVSQYGFGISLNKEELKSSNFNPEEEVLVIPLNKLILITDPKLFGLREILKVKEDDETIEDFIRKAVEKEIKRRKSIWEKKILEI